MARRGSGEILAGNLEYVPELSFLILFSKGLRYKVFSVEMDSKFESLRVHFVSDKYCTTLKDLGPRWTLAH